jgi:hypothetical protein
MLAVIRTDVLTTLSVDLLADPIIKTETVDRWESQQSQGLLSFPSILSSSCILPPAQISFIRILSKLTPNAQHLHLTLNLRLFEESLRRPLLRKRIESLGEEKGHFRCFCAALQPGRDGIPFPQMVSLEGALNLDDECQNVMDLREIFLNLLCLREQAGAPNLVLYEFDMAPQKPDIPEGKKFGWAVKFRAARPS